jgi:hypothetical protein
MDAAPLALPLDDDLTPEQEAELNRQAAAAVQAQRRMDRQ